MEMNSIFPYTFIWIYFSLVNYLFFYFSIWDDDGNDDEEDHGMFFFHFDLNRQMESMQREMEDMFRNFGAEEFSPGDYSINT